MSNPVQHSDFGEKIGGAKKDLWKERGLLSDDLSSMNEREADKYVKKDNIWKKPDYQAMIDSGLPVDVAYFIKTIRDSLNTSPTYRRGDNTPEARLSRQKQYIDTVRHIQGVIEDVKVPSDAFTAFSRCLIDTGYFERADSGISGMRYNITEKGRANPVVTNKLINALFITNERQFENIVTRVAAKKQFGVAKDSKIPAGYEIRFNSGKNTYSKDGDWKPDTYYVTKNRFIVKTNFETQADALKWVQDFAQQRRAGTKIKFTPRQLEHVEREGPDYRRGRNVDGQDYLATFGFKGGEFGNWMSQKDRQASLNMGFDALKDLAGALKISDRDISYQGALSIAFGARGSGSAVAHYEPLRQVINLTKMRGAGSLAHEWWHGLDDFMGRKMEARGLLSENPHKHPLFKKLINVIKYKPETPEQAAKRAQAADARTTKNAESWLKYSLQSHVSRIDDKDTTARYENLKDAFLRGEPGSVDNLNTFKKELTGRVIPKEDRERLISYEQILRNISEQTEPTIGKVPTDYYKASKEMGEVCGKDGGYWDSNAELTARAFATYIMDKLPGRSDYLAGHAECAVAMTTDKDNNLKIIRAYPVGEERAAINAVLDEIVAELKLQQHLNHDEHVQPESPPARREPPRDIPQYKPIGKGDQLTFDSIARPSVMDKLAAAKETVKAGGAEKSAPDKTNSKSHETQL